MKAYSLDLRQKIVQRYESGGVSQRELARQFQVSLNFIVTLLKRWRIEKTLEPKKRGGVLKPLLTPEIMSFVAEALAARCDLSLTELVECVQEKHQVSVSTKTMSRMLVRENLRYKKNANTPRKEIQRESSV